MQKKQVLVSISENTLEEAKSMVGNYFQRKTLEDVLEHALYYGVVALEKMNPPTVTEVDDRAIETFLRHARIRKTSVKRERVEKFLIRFAGFATPNPEINLSTTLTIRRYNGVRFGTQKNVLTHIYGLSGQAKNTMEFFKDNGFSEKFAQEAMIELGLLVRFKGNF